MSEDRPEYHDSRYYELFAKIKSEIYSTQLRVMTAANRELLVLYWNIGQVILNQERWGSGFIPKLSADLKREFPEIKGFSSRNLKYMKRFAEAFDLRDEIENMPVQISWSHITLLLERVKDPAIRNWYIQQDG